MSQASSELKARAPWNVDAIVVTLLVSQASGWLKPRAWRNVYSIVVTLLVSQPPICASKTSGKKLGAAARASRRVAAPRKKSSTRDVSQVEIGPCGASAAVWSDTHSSTAALSASPAHIEKNSSEPPTRPSY